MTLSMSSQETPYPRWSELLESLPAKWRSTFKDSTAALVGIRDNAYLIDVNGFDEKKYAELMEDPTFVSAFRKLVFPWGYHHPAGKKRRFWGVSMGNDLAKDTKFFRDELGATFTFVYPRRFKRELSE